MVRLTDRLDMTTAVDWGVKRENNVFSLSLTFKKGSCQLRTKVCALSTG